MIKQSGIRYGQKRQRGQSDTQQLIAVKQYLKTRWHISFNREWYVGFGKEDGLIYRILEDVKINEKDKFRWKNPDLLCVHNKFGIIVIEIDGSTHDHKTEKTRERNELYINSGVKFIVLNIADIKIRNQTLYSALDSEMYRVSGGGNI